MSVNTFQYLWNRNIRRKYLTYEQGQRKKTLLTNFFDSIWRHNFIHFWEEFQKFDSLNCGPIYSLPSVITYKTMPLTVSHVFFELITGKICAVHYSCFSGSISTFSCLQYLSHYVVVCPIFHNCLYQETGLNRIFIHRNLLPDKFNVNLVFDYMS